ncbi:FecR family protein [Sphingobacterium puteale]|uniref:FecR family protein n=1 Tax=Sphingobacterium puteale TaxID=2420510 RepID=UPI003D968A98
MDRSKDPNYISHLARKLQENTITKEELEEFEAWYDGFDNVLEITSGESREDMLQRIYDQIAQEANIRPADKVSKVWFMAAACLLFVFSFGGYFFYHSDLLDKASFSQHESVVPGGNKAILTLANGQKVKLDEVGDGQLAVEGNNNIIKSSDGQLRYEADFDDGKRIKSVGINELSTPLGGQYHLILADGSKVWLNSGSSIKFPTSFNPKERKVEVVGEAYFEVSHHPKWPFIVISREQIVQVLGTHFNVSAYEDEDRMRTTLLDGSVKVSTVKGSKMLKPGQEAVVNGENLSVTNADTEEAIAWKEGYFRFNNENIVPVMRKLARWYNVEVTFQGKITQEAFNGKISRSKNLDQALKMLEKTGVIHFKTEGRRVIVTQ